MTQKNASLANASEKGASIAYNLAINLQNAVCHFANSFIVGLGKHR